MDDNEVSVVTEIGINQRQSGGAPSETPSLLPMLIGGLALIVVGMIGVAVLV